MIGNGRSKTAIKQGIGKYSQGMECVVVPVYFQYMYLLFSLSDAFGLAPGRLHAYTPFNSGCNNTRGKLSQWACAQAGFQYLSAYSTRVLPPPCLCYDECTY